MDNTTLVNVLNRNNGTTGYVLKNSGAKRDWQPGQTIKVPFGELQQLQWEDGGSYMLENLLVVQDKDALEALNMSVEPEYFYTDAEIRLLLFTGTMDEFEDFLNFAPEGCLEVAKKIAVEEKIPDSNKREALSKRTGFNIDNAIYINKVMAEDEVEEEKTETKTRKATPLTAEKQAPARKTTPKYNVVSK